MSGELTVDLLAHLVCPAERTNLDHTKGELRCAAGHIFPVVQGVPVLLHPDLAATLPDVFEATRSHLQVPQELIAGEEAAEAFVQDWIVRTNGNLYRSLGRRLARYPIPTFPVHPVGDDEALLDVGGNWGRWAIAAAQKGFSVTVVDPNLEATLVGKQIASELGVAITYVVGDARALPFADGTFGTAFSYSVLQHFDKRVAREALAEMGRVLARGGRCLVQMPNVLGVRQATNLLRQRLARNSNPFRVRYWTPRELVAVGGRTVGPTSLAVDGYFSLNPRPEDRDLLPPFAGALLGASQRLTRLSHIAGLRWLRSCADSLWVLSERR